LIDWCSFADTFDSTFLLPDHVWISHVYGLLITLRYIYTVRYVYTDRSFLVTRSLP
jgi:hypothetical protein